MIPLSSFPRDRTIGTSGSDVGTRQTFGAAATTHVSKSGGNRIYFPMQSLEYNPHIWIDSEGCVVDRLLLFLYL
jgi:hypothetical protein